MYSLSDRFTCIIDPLLALHNTTRGYGCECHILAMYETPDDIKGGPIESHPQDSQIKPNTSGNIEHIPNYGEGLQVAAAQNTAGIEHIHDHSQDLQAKASSSQDKGKTKVIKDKGKGDKINKSSKFLINS